MGDEETDFIPLAALVANVVRWLEIGEQHQKDGQGQTCQKRDYEQRAEQNADAVESRLSDGATL